MTILILLSCSVALLAQCPVANFSVKNSACTNEQLQIQNLTTGSNLSFEWDFCEGDLSSAPQASPFLTLSSSNNPRGFKLVNDGQNWYAFVTSRSNNLLFRISFGTNLDNESPTVENLGNVSGLLSSPEDIKFFEENGNWYGLIHNSISNSIVRLGFGNNLGTDVLDISSSVAISGVGDTNTRLEIADDGSKIVVLLTNFSSNTITRIDFGGSILNNPIVTDVYNTSTITNALLDIEVFKHCDTWYGFTISYLNRTAYLLDFGNSLLNDPNPTLIADNAIFGTSLLSDISLLVDLGEYNFLLSTQEGDVFKLNIGTDPSSPVISAGSLGDFGLLSFTWASDFAKQNSNWLGFSISFSSRQVSKIEFPDNCSASIQVSNDENRIVSYQNPNTYKIGLKVVGENGEVSHTNKSVSITSDIAPAISFGLNTSRCIPTTTTFTPSNSNLTSYSWDFNGDGVEDSKEVNPEVKFDTLGGTGTYNVRLSVSDGTCDNFYEEKITIYDPPPAPSFTYSSPNTCVNTIYTFTNTTSDGSYTGPLEYLWEFIDQSAGIVEATATTKNTTYAFTTSGNKTVRLTSRIPGCSEVTEQDITITPGPTASFSSVPVCKGDAMQFTNTSIDAVSYHWDFGDGFTSTAENPDHIFTNAGNFMVVLTATDSKGCEATKSQEVAVSDSPNINFDSDALCTNGEGIRFFDRTTVTNADLVSWKWHVDDQEVSTLQNPKIVFTSTGIKRIRLDVQSSNGCEASYSEDVDVRLSPNPDFSISVGCLGEETTFTNTTSPNGNPIQLRKWIVNGQNYGDENVVKHVFDEAGVFDVSLEVTGQNFCSQSVTKTVEIIDLPQVDFSISGECANDIIRANDQTVDKGDPIVSRRWMLDGKNVGSGSQLLTENLTSETHALTLEVETTSGCIARSSQTFTIKQAPTSSFTSTKTYGIPGDQVIFRNTSKDAISYQWLLNGIVRSNNPEQESVVFEEKGTYSLGLVSQNSIGCSDTLIQQVFIVEPQIDLSVNKLELVKEDNAGRIFLEIQNKSNLPIEQVDVHISLEDQFSVVEQVVQSITIGEKKLIGLNVKIPLVNTEPAYFCVNLTSQYKDFPDIDPLNNEKCITIQSKVTVENPFPNPVTDQFRLKVLTPETGEVNISLINSTGKIYRDKVYSAVQGLNNFFIDMSTLDPGIYFVIVNVSGAISKKKIVKR